MAISRVKQLEQMHLSIIEQGDEDIYDDWITYGVPDQPTENDFLTIAEDDESYEEICSLYNRLMDIEDYDDEEEIEDYSDEEEIE